MISSGRLLGSERNVKMIKFDCMGCLSNKEILWQGYISKLLYSGSHLEISIHLADPITAVVCKTLPGFFVYFLRLETGLNLPSLFDTDENAGRLAQLFNDKDAITVAFAIKKVASLLSTSRRKRKPLNTPLYEIPF
jgi:hypothetical protein